mgnify:CR=1 FL=1
MVRTLEKVERRIGEKLFLKGDRCLGPKCAYVRHSQPPGMHGKGTRRRRDSSEFGALLKEKMKMRYYYGLDDSDIKRYVKVAALEKGAFHINILRLLERRLDSIVFRLGFAVSRRQARQMISHGHITVNDRRVSIPSYRVNVGDRVGIKEGSLTISPLFGDMQNRLRSYEAPKYLSLAKESFTGEVSALPELDERHLMLDATKVKEFYSR